MSSKTSKKSKKKNKAIHNVNKSKESCNSKKIVTYFTSEEIAEIKNILKTKDVTGAPLVIAATVLSKLDLLKALLKEGYNINQKSQNNMSGLMWAVKLKNLDVIEFLLNNGADPNIKTDSGDNILIQALEHKTWDEQSMITLWKSVKKVSFIDVNFANKNGHNMLHMCVRRDWEELLKLLLNEKPNMDAGNSNGVTPLMLASFRNNINIINILIEAGADILKEDIHGRMTLCYSILSSNRKPPFLATEKIISELRRRGLLSTYLRRRLGLIVATARRTEIPVSTSEMLLKILHFSIHFISETVNVFLECHVFNQLLEILEAQLENPNSVRFLLRICEEILFYNEESVGFKSEIYLRVLEDFYRSGFADGLLEIVKSESDQVKLAFDVFALGFKEGEQWERVLEENCNLILTFLNEESDEIANESHNKILKSKKRKMKQIFENLEIFASLPRDSEITETKRSENNLSRKSRKRFKAIKAKLSKIKSAELSKKFNIKTKKLSSSKIPVISSEFLDLWTIPDSTSKDENPMSDALQQLLDRDITFEKPKTEESLNWKEKILNLAAVDFGKNLDLDSEKLLEAITYLKNKSSCQRFDPNLNRSVNTIFEYLKEMVQLIIKKYNAHWENARKFGSCDCKDTKQHTPWLIAHHVKTLEAQEKEIIDSLQKNFEQLLKSLKQLSHKNLQEFIKALYKLESSILNHEIRGIRVKYLVCGMENFSLRYLTETVKIDDEGVIKYVEEVVNDLQSPREDITIKILDDSDENFYDEAYSSQSPIELFYHEMSALENPAPRNKRKEIESKLNTIANGFHLINSIMSVCNESEEDKKPTYGVSDLNYPLKKKPQKNLHLPQIAEMMPTRLKSQITSLQNCKSYQKLLNGDIRISLKEQRVNYIISAGINFNPVELGLDIKNQPLAVKRCPRESWIAKILKNLVEPILGLIDKHILHYYACDFYEDELVIATPLCKWNLSQYIQLLRHSSSTAVPNLTSLQIVKQFFDGLMVLHKCDSPIIHGNLKPSNIFIDFNGVVKIAEFGIHKALYKIVEAPRSSLIWFAKETLEIYRSSSIVECSLKSDIQVAGMLAYFTFTYGKHAYGEETEEILKNIQEGCPKLNSRNVDLKDMLLWMMVNDFNERPSIEQVISHPFFWSDAKKWNFILCCSGINQNGYLLPYNIEKLHRTIDSYRDSVLKIEWHEVFATKLSSTHISESNNLSGLLKFIKLYFEHNGPNFIDSELSCMILTLFPSVPVALYRMLQNTSWQKHVVFMPFFEIF